MINIISFLIICCFLFSCTRENNQNASSSGELVVDEKEKQQQEEFKPPKNWQGHYELVDSIVVVNNPGIGLSEKDSKELYQLDEDLIIEDRIKRNATDVKTDSRGNVYVLYDGNQRKIRKYDKYGQYVKDIQTERNGNFREIINFVIDNKDQLITCDIRFKYSFFDSTGLFFTSKTCSPNSPSFPVFHIIKNENLFLHSRNRKLKEELRYSIQHVSINSEYHKMIYKRILLPILKLKVFEFPGAKPSPYYAPYQKLSKKWHVNSQGFVFVADPISYQIEIYDLKGEAVKRITREFDEWVKVTIYDKAEVFTRFFSGFGSGIKDEMRKKIRAEYKFPKFKPAIERLFIDDKDMLWVQTYERNEDELKGVDLFDEQGIYLQRIWVEAFPSDVRNDYVYSILNDRRLVKRYKVHTVNKS